MSQIAIATDRDRRTPCRAWRVAAILLCGSPAALAGQVQIRLGDSARITYSEIHEQLTPGTPAADSVRALLRAGTTAALWPEVWAAAEGRAPWTRGLLALNRIAELRDPSSRDSVLAWRRRIINEELPPPPATNLRDLLPGLRAVQLELDRARDGDAAVLRDLLPRIPEGHYDLGDAWVFGRLGSGAADSVVRRFFATEDPALRIRYVTLLSFSADPGLIPFWEGVYAAPDSLGLPVRIGRRASDGLLWIGTRPALEALLRARAAARARGTYADPRLGGAGLDFLANDSSMAVSRTGRWVAAWLAR